MDDLFERRVSFERFSMDREESECRNDPTLKIDPCETMVWYKRCPTQHLLTDDEYRWTFFEDIHEAMVAISVDDYYSDPYRYEE